LADLVILCVVDLLGDRVAKNLGRTNHITKLEFLLYFKAGFDAAITKNNILGFEALT
jgi:hypothetical protein